MGNLSPISPLEASLKASKNQGMYSNFFKTSLELESLFAIVWKSSIKFRFLVFLRAKLAPPKASQMRVISNHNSNQVEWIDKVDASFQFWSLWISCWKCISWASELCSILLIRTEKNDYTYHRKKLLEHDNGDFESILWPSDIEAFKGLFQYVPNSRASTIHIFVIFSLRHHIHVHYRSVFRRSTLIRTYIRLLGTSMNSRIALESTAVHLST